jgi:hypothetical protein
MSPLIRCLLLPVVAFALAVPMAAQDKLPIGGSGSAYPGRVGAIKEKLLKERGGSAESEAAVARGLEWLAKQQKDDGSWQFEGDAKQDRVAATGLGLLPFLGAGHTHKTGKYQKTVANGLKFLVASRDAKGKFNVKAGHYMYSHGIATLALCEAYGMTRDRALLQRPAQLAINFLVAAQASDGAWGYNPGTRGDTSILGWQVQAIHAARQSRDIVVPDATLKKAIRFLDFVASGRLKAVYGYTSPEGKPGTALTAVGLWCRYHIDGWGPTHAGMAEGVEGLLKNRPPKAAPEKPDLYYYYYATQVVHLYDGPEWKDWNEGPLKDGKRAGGMRDWLVKLQVNNEFAPTSGSWDPDRTFVGLQCGRLGTTALSLLTLEVYYRHLPLYKPRDDGEPKGKDKDE